MAVEEEKGRRSDLCLKYCSQPLLLLSSPKTFVPRPFHSCAFRLFLVLSYPRDSRNELERLINSPFDQTWEESIAGDDKAVYCFTPELENLLREGLIGGNRRRKAEGTVEADYDRDEII